MNWASPRIFLSATSTAPKCLQTLLRTRSKSNHTCSTLRVELKGLQKKLSLKTVFAFVKIDAQTPFWKNKTKTKACYVEKTSHLFLAASGTVGTELHHHNTTHKHTHKPSPRQRTKKDLTNSTVQPALLSTWSESKRDSAKSKTVHVGSIATWTRCVTYWTSNNRTLQRSIQTPRSNRMVWQSKLCPL